MIDPLHLFLVFLKASALSFGGLGSLPILHQDLNRVGVSDALFGQALAVGRLSPGPNGLFVVSLGYQIDGLAGAIAATAAVLIPPFAIIAILVSYARVAHLKRSANALRTLNLAIAGSLGWTAWQIVAGSAASWVEWLLASVAFIISWRTRWHPLVLIGASAAFGIGLYLSGLA